MDIARAIDLEIEAQAAKARQVELSKELDICPGRLDINTVGATDVAYDKETDRAYAAIVVLDAKTLEVIDRASWSGMPGYPYVPGLFSLREASCLLEAFRELETVPDVIMVDGHGWAHPRRFGLACLLGWALDTPTIGCAKNNLAGAYDDPASERGARSAILDGEEQIGVVLRTQDGINPVFVSPGHGYDFETAADVVMALAGEDRIPEPLRQAHNYSIELRAADAEALGADAEEVES